ncbi:hypothetical protein DB35_15700 [Streptomyces abyssalis]|uniref:Integral membrane protein n=1 Tax=Streptomyces abyssalis TaxID=933944 RepID=A0A1E7JFS4_9ACTN|nr:DUF6350 family protein [Streptomyces abyssalis]OEU85323.1 hypothetical protein AN215_22310 [Streptomyces abyssalis]OEU91506.1 hypothetical protein DB35_15700 [Streptomyces abyssalis]OEV28491.1 hypothetical protein AN219_20550 [Streptomyces nanshensis]
MTHRSPTLSSYGPDVSRPLPSRAAWFLEGVLAAGLGLGAFTVLVLLLWIISPYPDSGAGGALHIAADLWLLGHGSGLVRTETLSGVPAPVALTPLLLVIAPLWLLYRAFVQALSADGEGGGGAHEGDESGPGKATGEETGEQPGVLTPLGCVAGGYLLTAAVTVLFASAGPVRADVLSALVRMPLFVLCVAVAAMWPAWGRTQQEAPNELDPSACSPNAADTAQTGDHAGRRMRFPAPGLREAGVLIRRLCPLRTALTAVAVLCGGGLLVTLGALLWHLDGVQAAFPRLAGGSWTGQFAVLLLVVALLPNAAVWAAAYGLGPGFALGAGPVIGPMTEGAGSTRLPPFPLLEALPSGAGGFGLLACAVAGMVPLAAGVTVGRYVGRAAVPLPGRAEGAFGRQATVCVVALVAFECGAVVSVLAAFSGGALGTGAMASLGPSWWLTGVAAFAWALLAGTPVALAVRSWRLRERGPDDDWHETAARQARWTALKTASGGLMPDFEPRRD